MKKQYEAPEAKLERFQAQEMLMISAGDGGQTDPPPIIGQSSKLTNGTIDLKFGD